MRSEKVYRRSLRETADQSSGTELIDAPTFARTVSTIEQEGIPIRANDATYIMVRGKPEAAFYGAEGRVRAIWCARSGIFGGAWTVVDSQDAILDQRQGCGTGLVHVEHKPGAVYIADDTWEEKAEGCCIIEPFCDHEPKGSRPEEGSWRSRPPLL